MIVAQSEEDRITARLNIGVAERLSASECLVSEVPSIVSDLAPNVEKTIGCE